METDVLIGIVSGGLMGWLSHLFFVKQKNRQLKESYYQKFLLVLHRKMHNSDSDAIKYTEIRNTILIIASSKVVKKLLEYEENGLSQSSIDIHNKYLTELIKAIRKDLNVCNISFPVSVGFKFFTGWLPNATDTEQTAQKDKRSKLEPGVIRAKQE